MKNTVLGRIIYTTYIWLVHNNLIIFFVHSDENFEIKESVAPVFAIRNEIQVCLFGLLAKSIYKNRLPAV